MVVLVQYAAPLLPMPLAGSSKPNRWRHRSSLQQAQSRERRRSTRHQRPWCFLLRRPLCSRRPRHRQMHSGAQRVEMQTSSAWRAAAVAEVGSTHRSQTCPPRPRAQRQSGRQRRLRAVHRPTQQRVLVREAARRAGEAADRGHLGAVQAANRGRRRREATCAAKVAVAWRHSAPICAPHRARAVHRERAAQERGRS